MHIVIAGNVNNHTCPPKNVCIVRVQVMVNDYSVKLHWIETSGHICTGAILTVGGNQTCGHYKAYCLFSWCIRGLSQLYVLANIWASNCPYLHTIQVLRIAAINRSKSAL